MSLPDAPSPPAPADDSGAVGEAAGFQFKKVSVRVLVGWMSLAEGQLWLAGRMQQTQQNDAHLARSRARTASLDGYVARGDMAE